MLKSNKARQVLKEGILQENLLSSAKLPLLFEVLFHEGSRGNHLLFSAEDMSENCFTSGSTAMQVVAVQQKRLEEVAVSLLNQSELSAMRTLIGTLNVTERQRLFRVYQRLLSSWQDHIKTSLN